MTNFEKYKDELCKILSYYVAVSDDKPCVCKDLSCKNCDFDNYALDCIQEVEDWLKKEVTKRRMVDVPDINVGNSSEIPNNSDCVSKRAAVEAIANQSRFSAEEIINICDKSIQDENGWLGGLKEAILAVLELPSAQPEADLQPTCNQLATDLISRQAVIDALTHKWDGMVTSVFDVLKELPSAQPERKKGKWISVKGSNGKDYHKCSECLHTQDITGVKNYCSVCGAEMMGVQDE